MMVMVRTSIVRQQKDKHVVEVYPHVSVVFYTDLGPSSLRFACHQLFFHEMKMDSLGSERTKQGPSFFREKRLFPCLADVC